MSRSQGAEQGGLAPVCHIDRAGPSCNAFADEPQIGRAGEWIDPLTWMGE